MKAFLSLARTRHTFQIVGIASVFTISSHGLSAQSLYAIISALCLSIAIFFLDDAKDHESDRLVHPHRPIPKGKLKIRQVYLTGVVVLVLGILSASLLLIYQFAIFLIVVTIAAAIVFLNIPSVLRAVLTAILIGALVPFSAFPDLKTMLFGVMVTLPHIGGSIMKDFLHLPGDQRRGLDPPPTWAKYAAGSAFFLAGAVLWLPVLLTYVNWLYIPPIVVTFASSVLLGISALKGNYRKVYTLGSIAMPFTLIAFLLSAL